MASVRLGGTANFPAVPGGDVGVGTIDETSPRHDSTVAANGDDDDAARSKSDLDRIESCLSIGVDAARSDPDPGAMPTDDLCNAVATSRGTRPPVMPILAVAAADISRALVLRS